MQTQLNSIEYIITKNRIDNQPQQLSNEMKKKIETITNKTNQTIECNWTKWYSWKSCNIYSIYELCNTEKQAAFRVQDETWINPNKMHQIADSFVRTGSIVFYWYWNC